MPSRLRELPGTVFRKTVWACLDCDLAGTRDTESVARNHALRDGHRVKVQVTRVVTLARQ